MTNRVNRVSRPLRIAALVKQIPEIESMTLGHSGRLLRESVAVQMNDYCRRAVAQGRQLAQESGGFLTVVTLGPPSAENVLREALLYGADDGVHICDPRFAGSDSLATARALAAALAQLEPFDLILLGRNSLDADTGQVPPQLTSMLGLPFVGGVRELALDGDLLRVRLEHDDEWIDAEVELPVMMSCAERLCDPCKIKDPSAWATIDSHRITHLSAADLGPGPWGQAGSATTVGAVRTVALSRDRYVVADGPVVEQVAAVIAVLEDRAALGDLAGITPTAVELPRSGSMSGPEILVAVEPGRPAVTSELLGKAAHLAAELGGRVVAFGPGPAASDQLSAQGADELILVEGSTAEEDLARSLSDRCLAKPPWAVLGPGTAWGRDVLARTAAELGAGLTGDAVGLEVRAGRLVAWKPAFGGQLIAEIHCSSTIQLATVRAGVLPRPAPRSSASIPVTRSVVEKRCRVRVIARERDDDSDELAIADTVIGVGMGVAIEDYALLRELANQPGVALAATRKVTDQGWMPRARQVGITGQTIAPRLFLSLGASGKFNHTVGIRAAGTVVAINTDPDAPIFGFADVGVVGDWRIVMPVLAEQIAASQAQSG
jgi:electron transfer flavoprotein alpha subunit